MSNAIWLLLLPPPSVEISLNSLRVAYGPPLKQILKDASSTTDQSGPVVDIAIAYEDSFIFSTWQKLLGLMYRLICIVCTELHIDVQYDNEINVRIVLFDPDWTSGRSRAENETNGSLIPKPLIDLSSLARIKRAWEYVCIPEGDLPERLAQTFVKCRHDPPLRNVPEIRLARLPGGLIMHQPSPKSLTRSQGRSSWHRSVALGGTFDHLHAGHKVLLTAAAVLLPPGANQETYLTIGITGDELLKNKEYREEVEDFSHRQSAVQDFLLAILQLMSSNHILQERKTIPTKQSSRREVHTMLQSGLLIRYVEIFDPYGPTITDEAISALVISAETRSGGQAVNDKRNEQGWPNLEVFEVDVLDNGEEDADQADNKFPNKVSSTDIRRRVYEKRHRT